jgi:hypothetical protein
MNDKTHQNREDAEHDERDEVRREAVNAADDTGMVRQQETLHEVEVDENGEAVAP